MGRKFHPSLLSQTRLLGYRDLDPSAANGDDDSVTTFLAYYSYHYYFLINQLYYTTDSYVRTLAVAYTHRLTNFFSPTKKPTQTNKQSPPLKGTLHHYLRMKICSEISDVNRETTFQVLVVIP